MGAKKRVIKSVTLTSAKEDCNELGGDKTLWGGCEEHRAAGLIVTYQEGAPGVVAYCNECKLPAVGFCLEEGDDTGGGEIYVYGDLIGFLTGIHEPKNMQELGKALLGGLKGVSEMEKNRKEKGDYKPATIKDLEKAAKLFPSLKKIKPIETEGTLPERWRGWSDN